MRSHVIDPADLFQPTLPLRGATEITQDSEDYGSFNPRSPCGERRDDELRLGYLVALVSTHAPLAGSDAYQTEIARTAGVSTHAPLAGSDYHVVI